MAGRGEYQKQLAALVVAAKANNLKFKDIVPDDMKEDVKELKAFNAAQEYIKELGNREKELQAAKKTLKKELDEKQSKIDSLPADYQSMKIDLQQAQRQNAFYKDMNADLEKRVERYRAQAKEIVDMKQADASATEKIEDLKMQIEDQKAVINKLIDDNRKSEAMFEQMRESDTKALERKDKQLAKKDKELAEKDELLAGLRQQVQEMYNVHAAQGNTNSMLSDNNEDREKFLEASCNELLAMQEQNISLLQENLSLAEQNHALEDRHIAMKTQLSEALAFDEPTHCNAQLFAAVMSEYKTLNRFYQASSQVLGSFAKCFSSSQTDIPSLAYIESQLDATQEALHGYFSVKKVVRSVINQSDDKDTDHVALCKELDSLAATASDSVSSLEILHQGLWFFLNQLSHDPKMLSDLNAAIDLAIKASNGKKDRLGRIEYYFGPSLFSEDLQVNSGRY